MSLRRPTQTRTGDQVPIPYPLTALAPPSFPSRPGSSILIDCRSQGSLTVVNSGRRWTSGRCRGQLITFDMLPDDVLLEMFDFYFDVDGYSKLSKRRLEEWIKLAHVCRRWRSVVFQSPLRLNLRLVCTAYTHARDTLDNWPPFPLIINNYFDIVYNGEEELTKLDNIVAGLEHNDRVREIRLERLTSSEMEYITHSAAMQKPFPELTELWLSMYGRELTNPILPDSFLGGTAPRLQSIRLVRVSFPGLPKLLLSVTHLVKLYLFDIPSTGYIPPEAMAIGLSALTSLESLTLYFRHPRPRPAQETRHPPPHPLTRSILPSLTKIYFKGVSEYLEEIFARIDAPQLDHLEISFFNQIVFDTPQLFQFISRRSTLRATQKGYIEFSRWSVEFRSNPYSRYSTLGRNVFYVQILCKVSEWQLSSLGQLCTSSLPPVSTLKDLHILEYRIHPPEWQDDIENTLWLELLRPFAVVKNLYVSKKFVPRIAPALEELVGGRSTEVLPILENIFLEGFQPSGPLHEGIEKFVAARRLTSHPVAVSGWYRRYW